MLGINSSDLSLKVVVQPSDPETALLFDHIGFRPVATVPQLFYYLIHEPHLDLQQSHLTNLFTALSLQIPETAQAACRYMVTQSSLDAQTVLVEFLNAQPLNTIVRLIQYSWFDQVLMQQNLAIYYQSIVDLNSKQVVAHECLARTENGKTGQQLIEAALATNRTSEFDQLARTTCIRELAAYRNGRFFINVLPNAIAQDPQSIEENFQQVLALGLRPDQIVFELTEVEAIKHDPNLAPLIDRIRALGFGLAIDDLCSNVRLDHYCTEFRPDIIKLDRRLIHGCSQYALKQIMIKSLLQTAHEIGVAVLAEGLETQSDIEFCCEVGVDLGQGFGLGIPEPHPEKLALCSISPLNPCCIEAC